MTDSKSELAKAVSQTAWRVETELSLDFENEVRNLKLQKAKCKSKFTRAKNKLYELVDSEERPPSKVLRCSIDELGEIQVEVIEVMVQLSETYSKLNEKSNVAKIDFEISVVEEEYAAVLEKTQNCLDDRSHAGSEMSFKLGRLFDIREQADAKSVKFEKSVAEENLPSGDQYVCKERVRMPVSSTSRSERISVPNIVRSDSQAIENDMWKQLRRVSIPVFTGDVRMYESWKAAFMTCVDQAPVTPEYKLLQLRQYLSGEALKVVQRLDHSAAAYDAALERLERKFGGKRRQISLQLEELSNFKPIREGNVKDVEKFADLIDIAVINLRNSDRVEELGNGSLYAILLKKMTQSMVTQFQRWVHENQRRESVETLREWVLQESEFQTVAAEAVYGIADRRKPEANARQKQSATFVNQRSKFENPSKQKQACELCAVSHEIWRCPVFRDMEVPERWNTAKKFSLCFRCLGGNHLGSKCTRTKTCGINGCSSNHNRMLHSVTKQLFTTCQSDIERAILKPNKSAVDSELGVSESGSGLGGTTKNKDRSHATLPNTANEEAIASLRTIPVILRNRSKSIVVNALLDDASTKTYINADVAAELGLQGTVQTLTVNVLNGQSETFHTKPVEFELESIDGAVKTTITACTTNRVTGEMQFINWAKHGQKWKHLQDIKFPKPGPRKIIDLLIGMDYIDLHHAHIEVCGKPGEPVARETPLGWTCVGTLTSTGDAVSYNHFAKTFVTTDKDVELNSMVQRFWEIDELESNESPQQTAEEKSILSKVEETLKHENGRYEVGIPWKSDAKSLPQNYDMAFRRLISTEKRLSKDTNIAETYDKTISEYLSKGYIQKVPKIESDGEWFLPHFPVLRPDKATTKVRIVFDASAKQEGMSLNDFIHAGPKLQRDLLEVLLRFRKHPIALVCDIAEMYLQIQIPPEDRPYHRFLWRSMKQNEKPEIYEFSRVVFGVTSSPFLAQYVAQQHAVSFQKQLPLAAETVCKSTYMDDSMDSVDDIPKAKELYRQLTELWSRAGMHARKWLSNSLDVLDGIPAEDRASEVDINSGYLPSVKALGLIWKAAEDLFIFRGNVDVPEEITKRVFLRQIAKLFDPLGFISPFVVKAKILMQKLWMTGVGWDEALVPDLESGIRKWFENLQDLQKIQIPRCLQFGSDATETCLHTFVDASNDAYAAVVYFVTSGKDRVKTSRLAASKSRVAPLKTVSVPRLELMAAVLGLRLTTVVTRALKLDIQTTIFWSDSMNTLWWIRNNSRMFKPFVAHRIGEIQAATHPSQWHYVPSGENPSDLLSRGASLAELSEKEMWWSGPPFLQKDESEWPKTNMKVSNTNGPERRAHKGGITTDNVSLTSTVQSSVWRLEPTRHSDWKKLTRINAWVYRFLNNCLAKTGERQRGELTVDEISDAETRIIVQMQKEAFPEEYDKLVKCKPIQSTSKLLALNPRLNEDGLLRCAGRLAHVEWLSTDSKFPIILPRKHWVTKLIVKFYHDDGKHIMGTNQVLAALSERYWVISGREEIRDWERECFMCRRNKSKAAQQIMAPLPRLRTKPSLRPFAQTGIDFAGPFVAVQGRGKKRQKRYLCLFTCLATRAVHLEMAYALDTDSFLNAFFRMASRRGVPEDVITDNGTNFVGAVKELNALVSMLDNSVVHRTLADKGIRWHFNPPSAPHFGGVFETMIKSAKRAIYTILGNGDLTDEELITAFAGAESLINSRPLTYQSANPQDDNPLTPNHFLHGQMGGRFAPKTVDETDFNPRKRWRRVQELVRHFWKRWMREWIPNLQTRKKWRSQSRDLQIGDVVLVVSSDVPRGHWQLGRILNTYPGIDGHTRVVDVQVGKSLLRRPINKLCPLEWSDEQDSDKS